MKPESEWFRPPRWLDNLARRGDWRIFCIIAEPEVGQGTYGVYYEVSEDLMLVTPFGVLEMLKKAAEGELRRRIESGDPQYKKGEGEMFESFRWNPMIVRSMGGRVTVRTDDEYVLVEPHYFGTGETLTTKNLYTRPGRTFTLPSPGEASDCTRWDKPVTGEGNDDGGTEVGPRS